MLEVQTLIAKVLVAERAERERRAKIALLIDGINADEEVWATCLMVKPPDDGRDVELQLLPPIKGKHRLGGSKQGYYESVHAFLKHRT